MDSSPPMFQVYRDDEHASVAAPLLLINRHDTETAHPRWSKRSNKNKNKNAVRGAIATGAFLATYLFFCAWVAFANNGSSLAQRGDSTAFPHRRFPWPFPGRRHPHPHPHHPPHPIVLGCTAIPSLSDVTTTHTAELNVSLPQHAVVLRGELLHKNVAIQKVNQSETEVMSEGCHKTNRTVLVTIKVANRTWWHHHPHPEAGEEDAESASRSFLLCAITFHGPHHGPHHPHHPTTTVTATPSVMEMSTVTATASEMEMEEQTTLESFEQRPHRPPHHRRPFHPPAVIGIFPAWNATHPKFPGPEELPSGDVDVSTDDSFLTTAWTSTISFLFPMLNVFPRHPHHGHPCHHRPPPPPPFVVTDLEVTLPLWTRVIFGHGPPPHGPWRHH